MDFKHLLALTLASALLLLISCGTDMGPGPGEIERSYSRETPEDLIATFSYAMEHQDIDVYAECLHPSYRFVHIDCLIPEWWECDFDLVWDKEEDVQNTDCMFGDPTVAEIVCDLPISGGPWATEDGVAYQLSPSIEFTVVNTETSEPDVHWVFSSWLFVEAVVDPSEAGLFVFREIVEISRNSAVAGASKGPTLLAEVKLMFMCDPK